MIKPCLARPLALALLAVLIGAGSPRALGQAIGVTAAQGQRIRTSMVDAAVKLVSKDFKFLKPGTITFGMLTGYMPFAVVGADNKTLVGTDPELAQLVADSLGLKLELIDVAWADWPLGVQSGRFDAAFANVTVTEERKKRFDFSTYRKDLLGFYVKKDSPIKEIHSPKDVAGLKIAVSPSTNQEQILLRWNKQNAAAGLKPAELLYFDDDAVRRLSLQSGRLDAYFGPNAEQAYEAKQVGNIRLAGLFPGGWPFDAEIAVVTRKNSGLADAITAALNAQIHNGNYEKVLERWNLSSEGIPTSRTNPPGLREE